MPDSKTGDHSADADIQERFNKSSQPSVVGEYAATMKASD